MTPKEFSSKIKEKYPSYVSMDDTELAKKVVEKYPVYRSQVEFSNPSLAEKSIVMAKSGGKMFGETVKSLNPLPVLKAGMEADKNYPAQNLLPYIGGGVGMEIGQPFLGGMLGSEAKFAVDEMRGVKTPPVEEMVAKSIEEGGISKLGDVTGKGIYKVMEGMNMNAYAREGFNKFIDNFRNVMKPTGKKTAEEILSKHAGEKIPEDALDEAKRIIDDFLTERDLSMRPGTEAGGLSPESAAYMEERGLSKEDIGLLGRIGHEADVESVAPKKSPFQMDYDKINYVKSQLERPDLTYKKLINIKREIRDLSRFGASDRTPGETILGKIGGEVEGGLQQTAKEGNFLNAHRLLNEIHAKYYGTSFVERALSESRDFPAKGEVHNYGTLSRSLSPKNISDKEVEGYFGKDAKHFYALRDLTFNNAKMTMQPMLTQPHFTSHGNIFTSLRPEALKARFGYEGNIENILQRRLGKEGTGQLLESLTPNMGVGRTAIRGTANLPQTLTPFLNYEGQIDENP